MIDPSRIRNPFWERSDNVRDPAALPVEGGYWIFYTRYSNDIWTRSENWAVARAFTTDFVTFEGDRDISPKGFASPGDPIRWHGRTVLPFQVYPTPPARLCYSESTDDHQWSDPTFFLAEANALAWNTRGRVIDPTLVLDGDTLHCFFVGSCDTEGETPERLAHANLLGHAVSMDPGLRKWEILTKDAPLIGRSETAPDGVENVAVFRMDDLWTMIYSEGLAKQHLALAESPDLVNWTPRGPVEIPHQQWLKAKHGAPFIWKEGEIWLMLLMGQNDQGRTTLGMLYSRDGIRWEGCAER